MSQRENLPESDQKLGAPDPETPDTTLRRGTLGLLGIIFFVVAASAPLAGMTGAFPVAVGIGNGAGAAGMYVAVGIVLLLFSVGYATMSHYVTNTGAFFAYVGRGLGIVPGVGSAAVSVLAYLAVQWAVIGFIAFQMKVQFEAKFGLVLEWWIYALAIIAIVYVLSALSVDIGAKFLGVLLTIELVALIVVGAAAIIDGGPEGPDFVASFSPSAVLAGGLTGGAGVAFAFALASFIGFEATAIYGEESKDPKKTVPTATYISVILITVIFAFVGFGMVTGLGATDIQNKVFEVTAVDGVPAGGPVRHALRPHHAVRRLVAHRAVRLDRPHVAVRGDAGLPEQRGSLPVLDGPCRRPAEAARPHQQAAGPVHGDHRRDRARRAHGDRGDHLQLGPDPERLLLVLVGLGHRDRADGDPREHRGHRVLPPHQGGHAGLEHDHRAGAGDHRPRAGRVHAHEPVQPARGRGPGSGDVPGRCRLGLWAVRDDVARLVPRAAAVHHLRRWA